MEFSILDASNYTFGSVTILADTRGLIVCRTEFLFTDGKLLVALDF